MCFYFLSGKSFYLFFLFLPYTGKCTMLKENDYETIFMKQKLNLKKNKKVN